MTGNKQNKSLAMYIREYSEPQNYATVNGQCSCAFECVLCTYAGIDYSVDPVSRLPYCRHLYMHVCLYRFAL